MIRIKASGLYSSIQDRGRFGYRSMGVPVGGAMDQHSAKLANYLVENDPSASVLEFTAKGPLLQIEEDTIIAVTGADVEFELEGIAVEMNKSIDVPRGSIIKLGTTQNGIRGYLAVKGGFDTERVLGSQSQFKGITPHAVLSKGDQLGVGAIEMANPPKVNGWSPVPLNLDQHQLQSVAGPEFGLLSPEMRAQIVQATFTVNPNSGRMAYILDHKLQLSANEIITGPVQPGTVQLTPSGKLMVLMRDAQTTGGYARILQLDEAAINILAQKRAGESVVFELITS